eukprot:TRINITY_DN20563_c0_g1_i1.p1 TRINITY_DN20563_c0_g1~~TRINITY_DN20563_c0_g1_i1.p1  ORF type:complete len:177 (-),score=16.65 TRINITY_DN20563_c0_g1_i1:113-643(-)
MQHQHCSSSSLNLPHFLQLTSDHDKYQRQFKSLGAAHKSDLEHTIDDLKQRICQLMKEHGKLRDYRILYHPNEVEYQTPINFYTADGQHIWDLVDAGESTLIVTTDVYSRSVEQSQAHGFVEKHRGKALVIFTEDPHGKRFFLYFESGRFYTIRDHYSIVRMQAAQHAIGALANIE